MSNQNRVIYLFSLRCSHDLSVLLPLILVLTAKVVPVFSKVYAELGSELTGTARTFCTSVPFSIIICLDLSLHFWYCLSSV